jgi:hypothetical protein
MDRVRASGALRRAPLTFVASLVTGVVDATADYMTSDPAHTEIHGTAASKHFGVSLPGLFKYPKSDWIPLCKL